ncbi:class I SAM-dependent methyltransferase [Chryseobacterium sp. MP_3.2]|uniref:class I SAM-dependent methyltransferase n=1 Tax=Chryseobacterium sp. MP_3.2 TaxID=3071712 RepID=UPI002DFC50FD|nr:putative O-methyltransferase YrrM [Chryseobacterium sp. MP_3.2]
MLKKILNTLKSKSEKKILISEIEEIYARIPIDFGGGCSIQKGLLMSLLISNFKLQKTVDLGVYRGRSLFPQAIAHKLFSDGVVFGVDPYSNLAAVQNDRPELQKDLDHFVKETDFNKLYNDVTSLIQSNKLTGNCMLVRETSADASSFFINNNYMLDLVHIDGNHDTKFVMEDANNYLPLLNDKSFIVLDDVSWDSVQPAFNLLMKKMIFVDKLIDTYNDFALFSQGLTAEEVKTVRDIFKQIKKTKGN